MKKPALSDLWVLDRTYFMSPAKNAKSILRDLATKGIRVNGTREFLNARVIFSYLERGDDFSWQGMGANIFEVNALLQAISNGDERFVSPTYDSKYYVFLKSEIDSVRELFRSDCAETRRAVIQFPSGHCFETIQVIVRDNNCIISTNMRSCNAYKNFMNDAYLAYKLAKWVVSGFDIEDFSMTMNIGSFHLFEEDLKHVL